MGCLLRLRRSFLAIHLLVLFSINFALKVSVPGAASNTHICLQKHFRKRLNPCIRLKPLWLQLQPLLNQVCKYLTEPRPPTASLGRWTLQVEQDMQPLQEQLQKILSAQAHRIDTCPAWNAFDNWLLSVTVETEVLELRVLVAAIQERMWADQTHAEGVLGQMSLFGSFGSHFPIHGPRAVLAWKQSGNIDEAQRFFRKLLDAKAGGVYPMRFLYDTEDVRRVTFEPWPGLPKLEWPDPKQVLPAGMGADLELHWKEIAQEAAGFSQSLADASDAYPALASHRQWTKEDIYHLGGWDEKMCSRMPRLCGILGSKLSSEKHKVAEWKQKGILTLADQVVTLYRVRGPGHVWMHFGQDFKVNVHLCLIGCNGSSITVAGEQRHYHDGSLFAFEDRADHEIENTAHVDRINLVIGVLHPGFDFNTSFEPTLSDRLRFILTTMEETPGLLPTTYLGDGLLLAAFYGYADAALKLLQAGAPIEHRDALGMTAIHIAVHSGSTDMVKLLCKWGANLAAADLEGFKPLDVSISGLQGQNLASASVLVAHRADIGAQGPKGTPLEVLQRSGNPDLVDWLKGLAREAEHPSFAEL